MNKPSEDDEAAIDATKAPLMDHLIELRSRLIWSILAFVVCFLICFYFAKPIYAFLTEPLAAALRGEPGQHMIATGLTETFFTYVKVGMFAGLCLAFPFIAAQLWMFVAPGLYKHERNAFLPFLAATPFLFILGAAFVFYIMLPNAIRFFCRCWAGSGSSRRRSCVRCGVTRSSACSRSPQSSRRPMRSR